jgi:hypothetical protein
MTSDAAWKQQGDRLYEQYGRPLEAEHWGEYVVITPDGRTLLAPTLAQAVLRASEVFGDGNFAFKIGPRVVATLR